jgi:hypothetical protein
MEGAARVLRVVLAQALLLAACRDPPRAWENDGAPVALGPAATPLAPLAPPAAEDLDGGASLLAEAGSMLVTEGGAEQLGPLEAPVRVGGPWVRCYGNFHPSGDPLRDVTRLSLLCGPSNGMKRITEQAMSGSVSEGGAPTTSTLPAKLGECYRVFAVAEPSVADLDVAVQSSRGTLIAADHGEDAWPIVQPDRPFCALEDDTLSIVVSAKKGSGRFAAEVFRLRSKP